jgi:mono/diheme cytochrome c family protein
MKALKLFFAMVILVLTTTGCLYNFLVPEEVPPTDPDNPDAPEVSFATDIVPIFTGNCASCHKTGGTPPDLTADKAYASINNTRYLNSASPEESRIYSIPHPDNSGHSQKKYTQAQAATILLWINQGAKNN